jgi:hypothetical protein
MNQFYVVLPSDSSMTSFPNNTVAHYKTKLPRRICDDGDYEVAITELIYPMNMYNLMHKEPMIIDVRAKHHRDDFRWEFKPGYFTDVEALVTYLNKELSEYYREAYAFDKLTEPLFEYSHDEDLISFSVAGVYNPDAANEKRVTHEAHQAGLNQAFRNFLNYPVVLQNYQLMYIYCDIVSPYTVGDVQTPLLRVVGLNGKPNEVKSVAFHNPYYLPVARRDFDEIEINLNTELGAPMPFRGGKSVVILHFKRRNEAVLPNTSFR